MGRNLNLSSPWYTESWYYLKSIPSQYNIKKLIQIFPTGMCNVTAWRHSRLRVHWLIALVGEGGGGLCWGRCMHFAFPGNCSVSYLSFIHGRGLWAELNGGENSLHWKANMLPLFSIMTLCLGTGLYLDLFWLHFMVNMLNFCIKTIFKIKQWIILL